MKVLSASYDDYANISYTYSESLRSIGIESEAVKIVPHPFGYKEQAKIVNYEEMKVLMREADIIIAYHSNIIIRDTFINSGSKAKLIAFHSGSNYRMKPGQMNAAWNPIVLMCLTDQTEFMNLGAKGIRYMATAIDTEKIQPYYRNITLPYIFAHYPSNAEVKGSKTINRIMTILSTQGYSDRCKYLFDDNKIAHGLQLGRMNGCDVYIELFKPELNGKPYGCFGVTAFEAAALGKIVITQNLNSDVYKNEYGINPFIVSDTEEQLFTRLEQIILLNKKEIRFKQIETRKWIEEKHSYKATAEKLKQILCTL